MLLAHSMGVFTGPRGIIGPPVVHRTEQYNLAIMPGMETQVDAQEIIKTIDKAYADVERIFGYKFTSKTRIVVVPYLENPNAVGGTSGTFWGTFVEVTLDGLDLDTFRHELIHVMVRLRNLPIPYGMNEGLAYYFGNPHGWDPSFLAILFREGPSQSLERPEGIPGSPGYEARDMQVLATGWATVFYLHRIKGLSPREISEMTEFPNPKEMWEEILKRRHQLRN